MHRVHRRRFVPPEPLAHVPALDGLRGLAVGAVLAFHLGYLRGGFLGVDLFFTLSGFLITRLVVDELARDEFSLRSFWARRARRLLPAAWMLIGIVLIAAPVLVRSTELGTLRGDAIATLGYGANWWQIATSSSYFAVFATPSPLQHTWSLAIEEQFYVVWPLLLLGLWHAGRRRVGLVVAAATALAITSLVAGALLYRAEDGGNRSYYGTDTRAASILIGALAALVVWRCGASLARWRSAEAVAALALVGIALAWRLGGTGAWLYRGGFAALAVAAAVVLAVVTTRPRGRVQRVLAWRPLVAVGVISYGVYLYHWPLFVWLSPERTGLGELPLAAVRLVATFSAAIGSFFVIERPYRRRQWPVPWRLTGAIVAGGTIAVAALTMPLPARLDTVQTAAAVSALAPAPVDQGPVLTSSGSTTTTMPPLPAPSRLLVLGDSAALSLSSGFANQAPPGVRVIDDAVAACGLGEEWPTIDFAGATKDPCASWRRDWPAAAEAADADGVLVLFGHEGAVRLIDGVWREPCDAAYDEWRRTELADALRTMAAIGPVWLVLAPYDRFGAISDDVVAARDAHMDCTHRVDRAAAAAAGPAVRIVDLAHFVCPQACVDEVNGVQLRPDGLHFDGPGGDVIARWLLDAVGLGA